MPQEIYSLEDAKTPAAVREFERAARRDRPLRIDERTYIAFRDREGEPGVTHDYPIAMADGTERHCDFVHTAGDDAHFPYLGFWREGEQFWCQHIEDRLIPTEDETDNYLPPPGVDVSALRQTGLGPPAVPR